MTSPTPIYKLKKEPMRVAGFMSGSGSNLREILKYQKSLKNPSFRIVLIFSDVEDKNVCKGEKIADEYGVPYFCNDIMRFYSSKGLHDKKDMDVRKEYDKNTAELLKKFDIDLIALCGYMSLVTEDIFENFLTINLHPADLSIVENGKRKYAGLQAEGAVLKALLAGETHTRSCIHVVRKDADMGELLARSVPLEFMGDMSKIEDKNALKIISKYHLEVQKRVCEWTMYPKVIELIARGRFQKDKIGVLYFDDKPVPHGADMSEIQGISEHAQEHARVLDMSDIK